LRPRDAVAGEGGARGRARLFRAALRRDTGRVATRRLHRRCRRAAYRATHGGRAHARGASRGRARRARAHEGGKSVRVSFSESDLGGFRGDEIGTAKAGYDHTRTTSLPITWRFASALSAVGVSASG